MAPKRAAAPDDDTKAQKRPKLTDMEKAQKLTQRAAEATNKANVTFIVETMKNNPVVVTSMVNHLKQLGFYKNADGEAVAPTVPPSPGGSSVSDGLSVVDAARARDAIPGCYRTLDSAPPLYLERLVELVEPVSFSKQQCKLLTSNRRRCTQREPFLQLLECVCEIDREMPLLRNGIDFHNIGVFSEYLKKQSELRGRRGRDMTLPPRWQNVGLYDLTVDGEIICIAEHYTTPGHPKRSVRIVWADEGIKDPAAVYVSENWSQSKARLREEASWYARPVEALLPKKPTLPDENPTLAIEGGGDQTPIKGSSGLAGQLALSDGPTTPVKASSASSVALGSDGSATRSDCVSPSPAETVRGGASPKDEEPLVSEEKDVVPPPPEDLEDGLAEVKPPPGLSAEEIFEEEAAEEDEAAEEPEEEA